MINTDAATRIIRLPELLRITGLSRSTIYLRVSQGKFPKQIVLGERAVGWLDNEISAWVESRILESR